MKTGIFLYEPQQVERLSELPLPVLGEERTIIACNAEVEFLLEKLDMSFQSARDLRPTPVSDRLILGGKIGHTVLTNPHMSFFTYKDIHLGDLYTPTLQFYLAIFLYYLDIVASAVEVDSYDQIIVLDSLSLISPTGGLLHIFDLQMMVNAVRIVCEQKNIEYSVHTFSGSRTIQSSGTTRMLLGWGIGVLNTFVALTVRPKKIRILASENWKNIEPLMKELPESELLLLDRAESLKAGVRAIWANRMRFIHSEDFLSSAMKTKAKILSAEFLTNWKKISDIPELFEEATFRGYQLKPHLEKILSRIIETGGEKAIHDIEGIHALCARTKPDLVMVRAGVSAQTHFSVLCKVAKSLGIPSLEIQHGTLYFGPESYATERAAEYVAEYGPQVRADLKTIDYDDAHLFDVGSPRFDAYKETHAHKTWSEKTDTYRITAISPRVAPGFWTDSYAVFDYYKSMAQAIQPITNSFVTIKLRPVPAKDAFYREAIARAFKEVPHAIAQYEAITDIFATTDVIVSCYSTVLIESLLSGRPTIYFSGGLATYEFLAQSGENAAAISAGALLLVKTVPELTSVLQKFSTEETAVRTVTSAADTFMEDNYSFDGNSAKRLADVVRTLAA